MLRSTTYFLLAMCSAGGCLGFPYDASMAISPAAHQAGIRRLRLRAGAFAGLSDVTAAPDGTLWAIPERQRAILTLGPTSSMTMGMADRGITAVLGVAQGFDTESFAYLAPGRFAVGTESQIPERGHDDVLLIDQTARGYEVTGTLPMRYAAWNMTARKNDGIEGLCAAGSHLLASVETTHELADGGRVAPLGRFDAERGQWAPFFVRLTSEIGKLSAIACRPLGASTPNVAADLAVRLDQAANAPARHNTLAVGADDTVPIEVFAIERHYGVGRILRFVVPGVATAGGEEPEVLQSEVVLDLADIMLPLPNFEGLTWLQNGDMFLISDNQTGFITGPTQALIIPKAVLDAQAGVP